jgi:hypothetical protein
VGLVADIRPTSKGNHIVNALKGRSGLRTLLGLLAALGLVAAMAMPVAASSQIFLHEPHKGIDSADAPSFEADDCGDFTTGVVWHFILNQYDGDDAGTIFATFEDAGVLSDEATKVVGAQHFYLNTPTDDVLVDAYVEVDGEAGDANLVLSHICHTGNEATPTPTPTPEVTPTPTPESSEEAGTPTPTATPREDTQGGNPTPTAAPLPNTAMGSAGTVPALALSLMLIGSLAAMAYLRVARQR